MNLGELDREVRELIKDQSPTILASIGDYINEAIAQIAEDVRFPELKQVGSVTTSTSTYYVSMPSTFSGRLVYAGSTTSKYTILEGGIESLLEKYPSLDESGDIEYIVCESGLFYYQPIPTTETVVTIVGYHTPPLLTNDTDTPSFIPFYLQRESIVNLAVSKAYSIIEDGEEADKINTKLFRGLAGQGIIKLMEYVSKRRAVTTTPAWSV